MPTNLELAVANLVSSNQDVVLTNLLEAYSRVAGYTEPCRDAVIGFEHAMDKHPQCIENTADSRHTKVIADLRQAYWSQQLGGFANGVGQGKPLECPCCGVVSLAQSYKPNAMNYYEHELLHEVIFGMSSFSTFDESLIFTFPPGAEPPKAERTKSKAKAKAKSKNTKRRRAALMKKAFDPYGPSTSASSI